MSVSGDRPCPVCGHADVADYALVQDFAFFECRSCESLYLDPLVLDRIDGGDSLVTYDAGYWTEELAAARARAYGSSLARVAEALLYVRRDVEVFLDIGSGPGYLLDACRLYMPGSAERFFGVERFPPPASTATNPNLIAGGLADLTLQADAGCCIEVIEHLTPRMVDGLLADLAAVSRPQALFIINSGQPAYVKHEDPRYLDPTRRGHIVSYSVKGFDGLARPHGFRARALPGKTWAFALEKTEQAHDPIADRIWSASPHNRAILSDPIMGSVMYILGLESARAYS